MTFRYREQNATLRAFIKFLCSVVFLLLLSLYGAGYGWHSALKEQTFHVPPDLRSGAKVKVGEVPVPNVYTFAYYIYQQLNRWPTDGSEDYGSAIFRMAPYVTPKYRAFLEADLERRGKRGELTGRSRAVQEFADYGYEESRVEVLGNGSWIVWLDVHIHETVKGMTVKATGLRVPLHVVRYDVDPQDNAFGLALNGYGGEGPRRLKEKDAAQSVQAPPGSS